MLKFFDWIVNLFSTAWDSFVAMCENFISFCEQIGNGYVFMTTAISSLPAFCQGALLTILCISVLTMLISLFIDVA